MGDLLAAAGFMYWHSRKAPVDHDNVNDEWDAQPASRDTAEKLAL